MPKFFAKNFDVVCIGGAVRDITFYTDKGRMFRLPENLTAQRMLAFEYGAKIPVHDAHYTLGGGAANTSLVFSRLGLKAGVLTCIGADAEGQGIADELKLAGVATDAIQRTARARTGFSFIVATSKKDHDHVLFAHRGANDHLDVGEGFMNKVAAKWLYITSLSGEHWLKNLRNIITSGRKKNVKIAWNPGVAQLQAGKKTLEKILPSIDVLILNKDEATELVLSGIKLGSRNPKFLSKTAYLLHLLREWGPKTVVITDGEKGASALRAEKIHAVKAVKRPVVDTTGVGDTFGATFITGLIKNQSIDTALAWGVTNAAANLTQVGAQEGVLRLNDLLQAVPKKLRS